MSINQTPLNVFLVEDDQRLASLIQEFMNKHQIRIIHESHGDNAVVRILKEKPDIVVLDVMLPGKNGFQICRELRPQFENPILMLTARDEDADQIHGLETCGADDYLTKPIEPRMLLARLRAQSRHIQSDQTDDEKNIEFGILQIDTAKREVVLSGNTVDLTNNEYELCVLLAKNAGNVLSRDKILAHTRGIEYDGLDRSVDVRISRLRKKLGDDAEKPFRIKTIWGKGYLFVPDAWEHDTT